MKTTFFLKPYLPFALYILMTMGLFMSDSARAQPQERTCEPVSFAGIEVICFNHGIGSFSTHERAAAIRERIDSLARNPTFDIDKIKSLDKETSSDIVADDLVIASLRDEDLDPTVAKTRSEMAETVASRIRAAIDAERTLKSPTQLLWGIGYTALASLGLILLLMGLSRAYPKIYRAIRNSDGRYIRTLKIQSFEVLNSSRIIAALLWLAQMSRVLITILALYIYLPLVLSFFPWTANLAPRLLEIILNPLMTIYRVAVDFIPNLFFIVAIILVTRYVLKFVRFIFTEVESGRLQFEGFYREWADPTYKLVRVLILAFAFVMTFPYLPGSSSPAFQGISVFLGLLLSLGSSSAVSNIVAGVVLTYMRPFKNGDRVKISDTVGDVLERTLLVTRIRSIKNVDITIPNSMILGSHIINYSATAEREGLVLNTTVTIGYDVPWRKVHELLKDAAARTDEVLKEKKPFVLQTALNDFYVAYELNAYTSSPNHMATIYSQLHQNIQDCFNEAGVEIMSPHYSALRDGNEIAIPAENRAKDYLPSGFRVENAERN